MQTFPLPPMFKLFSAGAVFGGFWTPPEDDVPTSLAGGARFGLVIPDSPMELDATLCFSSGETRRGGYEEDTSYLHADLLTDLVDEPEWAVAVGGGLGWRHLLLSNERVNGVTPQTALGYAVNPAIDLLIVATSEARVHLIGPLHLRADISGFLSVGGEPAREQTHLRPGASATVGVDLRWEPPPDHDHDGVADTEDRCPDSLEDFDYFDDTDGCLDPDDDRDKIPDVVDKCKDIAEDMDAYQDSDGCPEANNDKDAFPDTNDQCPNDPETENSWEDGDGCPDSIPDDIALVLARGKELKFDGAKLLPESEPALLELQGLLGKYPSIILLVSAYNDSEHGATAARELSLAQCKVIYDWFIAHGVDFHRVEFRWPGDTRLLNDDRTAADHLANRRVELGLYDNVGADGKPIEFNPLPIDQWR